MTPDPFPGEFRLVRRLGGGSFGEVWLADDLSPLARPVALKFLRAPPDRLEVARAALENEARVLAALRHPNIVPVLHWKTVADSGLPCLVMGYVDGGSFEAAVEGSGPLGWTSAARYVADIADGLLLVHRKGVIHRDIKPANLLWDLETDEALLADFGIAARLAGPPSVGGTPRFMAPEAHFGDVSPALDVYGLAASQFWLMTARPPFGGANRDEIREAIKSGLPQGEPLLAAVPKAVRELIRAALSFDPRRRPALADFASELRAALNGVLAEAMTLPGGAGVQLIVSRHAGGRFEPVGPTELVRTGDRVRIEARAEQAGHLTVFNVGPTGNLHLLWPAAPGEAPPQVEAGRALPVLDAELTPPAGRERLFAVWTREPLPLRLDELGGLAGGAYEATRDMVRVRQSLAALPAGQRQIVVRELDHR